MKMGGYGFIIPVQHEQNLKEILQFHYKLDIGMDATRQSTTTGKGGTMTNGKRLVA
jgi:hypothetical protein